MTPSPARTYSISEVADRTGVTADSLRYDERIGLLEVGREPAGRRRYDERNMDGPYELECAPGKG